MERPHRVPVKKAEQSMGCKIGCDGEQSFPWILRLRLELQPGLARQFHLGTQTQKTILLHVLHAPKIKRLASADFVWMPAPASQPHTTDGLIEPAAHAPRPIHIQPAALTTDPRIGAEHIMR